MLNPTHVHYWSELSKLYLRAANVGRFLCREKAKESLGNLFHGLENSLGRRDNLRATMRIAPDFSFVSGGFASFPGSYI